MKIRSEFVGNERTVRNTRCEARKTVTVTVIAEKKSYPVHYEYADRTIKSYLDKCYPQLNFLFVFTIGPEQLVRVSGEIGSKKDCIIEDIIRILDDCFM